jgi:S-adenosylmethionine:tRNA ribosyltransferase-isomerase
MQFFTKINKLKSIIKVKQPLLLHPMMNLQPIKANNFRYDLPKERIAQYPLAQRDLSKLLVRHNGALSTAVFRDLPGLLPENALLLFNDTRVIRARVLFRKETGAEIELFFLNPLQPSGDHAIAFSSGSPAKWECIIGNARKWKGGDLKLRFQCEEFDTTLNASLIEKGDESSMVELTWEPAHLTLAAIFEAIGHTPLPPYINRHDEPEDTRRYQTVYAQHNGSVAAPTAGLHFTPEMLETLASKGIPQANITLHVGAGTFKPVSSSDISEHVMHREEMIVSLELLQKLADHKGPVIPVGTTSVRSIESLYWYGLRVMNDDETLSGHFSVHQWEPYGYDQERLPAASIVFDHLLKKMNLQQMSTLRGDTSLIIMPGYRFAVTNGLITNFHQPGSTLLLLVAALIGNDWKKVYQYALDNDFRFLSYGDACFFMG